MKPKKTSPALLIACPQCGAKPGAKCVNYLGKGCAPHRQRIHGVEHNERHFAEAVKKSGREADKVKAEAAALPLFAEQVLEEGRAEVRTPLENYWRTRFMIARNAVDKDPVTHFWKEWDVRFMRQLAQKTFPPDWFAAMDGVRWKGDEWFYWQGLLTTSKGRTLTYHRRVDCGPFMFRYMNSQTGKEVIDVLSERAYIWPDKVFPPEGWKVPYTPAELEALLGRAPDVAAVDEAGEFALTVGLIGGAR